MHKFLTFLLTVGGSVLIMSSVTFAQNPNPLPLGETGYDKIFTENRAAQVVDFSKVDTGEGLHRLFVKYNYK